MDVTAPFDDVNDVLAVAEQWMNEGRELVIATVVEGDGPAQSLIGRRMIIDAGGAIFGGFDCNALELAAQARAAVTLATGEQQLLDIELPHGHACLYVERLG